jgi:hypothetical protein
MKTQGQIAYEAELDAKPLYHDGTPRRPWEQIDDVCKLSWERNPTPRRTKAPHTAS